MPFLAARKDAGGRGGARFVPRGSAPAAGSESDTPMPPVGGTSELDRPRPPSDVQAALYVLGRRPNRPERYRLGLGRADLTGAQLIGANLYGANLSRANLTRADLVRADPTDTNLMDAVLPKGFTRR